MNVPHSPEFFAQMRTRTVAYRALGQAFAAVLDATACVEVFDFGCGVGIQCAELAREGFKVFGFDPCCDSPAPGFSFVRADPIGLMCRPADAVVCTETAEHVYEHRADALVETCTRHARRAIIWSSAVPGQEWEGHVNLQPHAYWIDKFAARGWRADHVLTGLLRERMTTLGAQHCGAVENFFVLVPA